METKIRKENLYEYNQKVIKQLNRLEKMAWIVFVIVGIGYVVASVIVNS